MERVIQKVQFSMPKQPKLKRVAAYARVSNGKDAMLHSLSAQVSYYSDLIQNHRGWLYCGVYADEALTGTKDSRENFQKMLAECRAGNLDLIITKSISRFARNTVTLLETVRELKDMGVDVYFEEQNIYTMSADGELMLSILASYAQEESLSASENKKWQIRKDFEQGKIGSITMLGYRRNADGVLEIEPDEAAIVRMIFVDYLSGMGQRKIANKLNEMGIPTRQGNLWTNPRIREILVNEKYTGKLILQKYYRNNHIEKRKTLNRGELTKYCLEEAHEPIIDMETFQKSQEILEQRHSQFYHEGATTRYPLSGMIVCAACGKNYQRKLYSQGGTWLCATYARRGKKYCPTAKQIPEKILLHLVCEVLQLKEFDEYDLKDNILRIVVTKPYELQFIFHDGSSVLKNWQHTSRSESWTDEMKQTASERSKRWNEESQ